MSNFIGFSIDKLELCFSAPVDALYYFQEESIFDSGCFTFTKTCHNNARLQFNIRFNDTDEALSGTKVGTLRASLSDFYNDTDTVYLWLALDNKYLYSFESQAPIIDHLNQLKECLGMTLHNISKCEIACDSDINLVDVTHELIRDTSRRLYVLGREVKDFNTLIKSIVYETWESRREEGLRHIRIKGKSPKFQMYFYDKLQEIHEHNKEYILDYYHQEPATLYRAEVRFDKDHSWDIIKQLNTNLDDFITNILTDNDYCCGVWNFISKKFIRFKKNRRSILSVLELGILDSIKN